MWSAVAPPARVRSCARSSGRTIAYVIPASVITTKVLDAENVAARSIAETLFPVLPSVR